jgi:hypothetical protein
VVGDAPMASRREKRRKDGDKGRRREKRHRKDGDKSSRREKRHRVGDKGSRREKRHRVGDKGDDKGDDRDGVSMYTLSQMYKTLISKYGKAVAWEVVQQGVADAFGCSPGRLPALRTDSSLPRAASDRLEWRDPLQECMYIRSCLDNSASSAAAGSSSSGGLAPETEEGAVAETPAAETEVGVVAEADAQTEESVVAEGPAAKPEVGVVAEAAAELEESVVAEGPTAESSDSSDGSSSESDSSSSEGLAPETEEGVMDEAAEAAAETEEGVVAETPAAETEVGVVAEGPAAELNAEEAVVAPLPAEVKVELEEVMAAGESAASASSSKALSATTRCRYLWEVEHRLTMTSGRKTDRPLTESEFDVRLAALYDDAKAMKFVGPRKRLLARLNLITANDSAVLQVKRHAVLEHEQTRAVFESGLATVNAKLDRLIERTTA